MCCLLCVVDVVCSFVDIFVQTNAKNQSNHEQSRNSIQSPNSGKKKKGEEKNDKQADT